MCLANIRLLAVSAGPCICYINSIYLLKTEPPLMLCALKHVQSSSIQEIVKHILNIYLDHVITNGKIRCGGVALIDE